MLIEYSLQKTVIFQYKPKTNAVLLGYNAYNDSQVESRTVNNHVEKQQQLCDIKKFQHN